MSRPKLINDIIYTDVMEIFSFPLQSDIKNMSSCLQTTLESMAVLNDIRLITTDVEINPATEKLYHICTQHNLKKLGLENIVMLSKESTISISDNIYLSNEVVKEALENTMKAIMALFTKMTDTVQDLWKQYAVATGALKKRIETTQKIIDKINKDNVDAKFKDSSIASAIKLNNQIIIDQQIVNSEKIVGEIHKEFADFYSVSEAIKSLVDDGGVSTTSLSDVINKNGNKNLEMFSSKEPQPLVGNKSIQLTYQEEGDNFKLDFKIVPIKSENLDPEVPVLSLEAMHKYLSSLSKLAGAIDGFKNDSNKTNASLKNLLSAVQKAVTEERNKVKKGKTSSESFSLSLEEEANKEENNANKEDNKDSKEDKTIEKKGELAEKETKTSSITHSLLNFTKALIRTHGNLSYMPQKVMIDGCYKVMAYIDKSIAFYK